MHGPRRSLALLAVSALAGLSLLASVAGGATARSSGSAVKGKYASALAYSRCMRSHGVPNFPDPKLVAGGGIQVSGSAPGVNRQSPLFSAAQRSCRPLLPNGGEPTRAGQQKEVAVLLHASHCMRAHGVPGFPDPSLSAPSNRAGYSTIMSNDGVWLAIPNSIDVRAPAVERAAAACNLGLS